MIDMYYTMSVFISSNIRKENPQNALFFLFSNIVEAQGTNEIISYTHFKKSMKSLFTHPLTDAHEFTHLKIGCAITVHYDLHSVLRARV